MTLDAGPRLLYMLLTVNGNKIALDEMRNHVHLNLVFGTCPKEWYSSAQARGRKFKYGGH